MANGDSVGADIAVKVAGQEFNVRNVKSLNTIATVTSLIVVCTLGVFLYFHEATAQQDKAQTAATLAKSNAEIASALKENNKILVDAMKEQSMNTLNALGRLTSATKEIACLSDPAMKNRNDARDFCKRITREDR